MGGLAEMSGRALVDALEIEQRLARDVRSSDDAREGAAAFAEKRPPRFSGR